MNRIYLLVLISFLQFHMASCDKRSDDTKEEDKTENVVKDSIDINDEDSGPELIFVPYDNSEIMYSGRIDTTSTNAAQLFWSSSSIRLNFKGTDIKALMQDENFDTYYTVIIDDEPILTLQPEMDENYVILAEGLSDGEHSVELHRNSEWSRGNTIFKGFEITGKPQVLPKSEDKLKKIVFYGDSVTLGGGVNDTSGDDSVSGSLTDSYKSYASISARYFNADYRLICSGGIGLMVSWYPQTMLDLYDKLNPSKPDSTWNFLLYQPDVVVVNLCQNDSWIIQQPGNHNFMRVFGDTPPTDDFIVGAYKDFISDLRQKYPDANIICMLGNMDVTYTEKWPNYIRQAVQELNDDNVYAHFVPFKGTGGHPSILEQGSMAESLIGFIEENIGW